MSNDTEAILHMKEVMAVVYLDIEKEYDSIWKEGVLIKAGQLGIGGKMYNWMLDFYHIVLSGLKWDQICLMSLK